jgi:hypothetical protein
MLRAWRHSWLNAVATLLEANRDCSKGFSFALRVLDGVLAAPVVGVDAGLLLLRLSRGLCFLYFLALLATVRGGTSFLCPTATKKRSKENAFPPRAS